MSLIKKVCVSMGIAVSCLAISSGVLAAPEPESLWVTVEKSDIGFHNVGLNSAKVIQAGPPIYIIEGQDSFTDKNGKKPLIRRSQYTYNENNHTITAKLVKMSSDGGPLGRWLGEDYKSDDVQDISEDGRGNYMANILFYRFYGRFFTPSLQKQYEANPVDILQNVRKDIK